MRSWWQLMAVAGFWAVIAALLGTLVGAGALGWIGLLVGAGLLTSLADRQRFYGLDPPSQRRQR